MTTATIVRATTFDLCAAVEHKPLRPSEPPALVDGSELLPITTGKTATSLDYALRTLAVELRYNIRTHKPEWAYVGDHDYTRPRHEARLCGWRDLTDISQSFLQDCLSRQFTLQTAGGDEKPFTMGRDLWHKNLNVLLYQRQVDPFRQWLEGLPPWDGRGRLGGWLVALFDVRDVDHELAQWASEFLCLGAVWRTYEPGVKLDEMPVLIGRGGIGKSTALKQLLPEVLPDAFSDSLNLSGDNKERTEALAGRVLVEVSEMVGYQRADQESLKAFLSRTDDGGVRLAYRRNPETMLRRCVLAGTADHDQPLPNDPNLRRFVPVRLDAGNPEYVYEYMARNRERLWAEALWMYRDGIEARFPDHLKPIQKQATDAARSSDMLLEDAVDGFLQNAPDAFTLAAVADAVNLVTTKDHGAKLDSISERRLVKVLRMRRYSAKRMRGPEGNKRYWTPADA